MPITYGKRYAEIEPVRFGYHIRTKAPVVDATTGRGYSDRTDYHETWRPTFRWAEAKGRHMVRKQDTADARNAHMKANITRVDP